MKLDQQVTVARQITEGKTEGKLDTQNGYLYWKLDVYEWGDEDTQNRHPVPSSCPECGVDTLYATRKKKEFQGTKYELIECVACGYEIPELHISD